MLSSKKKEVDFTIVIKDQQEYKEKNPHYGMTRKGERGRLALMILIISLFLICDE